MLDAHVQNGVEAKSNFIQGVLLTFLAFCWSRRSGIWLARATHLDHSSGVGEKLYVHAADDRSSLETNLASRRQCHTNLSWGRGRVSD